jgi:hypothetical protein
MRSILCSGGDQLHVPPSLRLFTNQLALILKVEPETVSFDQDSE